MIRANIGKTPMLIYLKKIKYALTDSKFQFTAKVCYDLLVYIELALQRFFDSLNLGVPSEHSELLNELTIVIKTFERYKTLARLLRSIRRYYPSVKIIVVDDSFHRKEIKYVKKIYISCDSGVSAGKNEGLKYVTTKYALFLDDDFVFFRKTRIEDSLHLIDSDSRIDILGGQSYWPPFLYSS